MKNLFGIILLTILFCSQAHPVGNGKTKKQRFNAKNNNQNKGITFYWGDEKNKKNSFSSKKEKRKRNFEKSRKDQ